MLTHDEKRDYIRMEVDCDVTYKPVSSSNIKTGRCTTLSGSGISFIADQAYEAGLAMEINVIPKTNITPPMAAYVEVVRCSRRGDNEYEIAASIKSIKGS